jgi:hypothetical protein
MAGRDVPLAVMFTLPIRLFASFLSTIFSAFVSSWYLASFTALTSGHR